MPVWISREMNLKEEIAITFVDTLLEELCKNHILIVQQMRYLAGMGTHVKAQRSLSGDVVMLVMKLPYATYCAVGLSTVENRILEYPGTHNTA